MPSFSDSIFLFILALLLFGPKKLPVLARELGKWIGEFRRASNEFKMQMEEELRQAEQADRQKQIAAMEAAAPVVPTPEPEHPHLPAPVAEPAGFADSSTSLAAEAESPAGGSTGTSSDPTSADAVPLPIATSGSLSIMPPSTGLPTPRSRADNHGPGDAARPDASAGSDPLGSLLDSLPAASASNAAYAADGSAEAPDALAANGRNGAVPEVTAHGR